MFILIIIVCLTLLEAIYEGLFLLGKKTLSGVIEFIQRAAIPVMIVLIFFDQKYDYYFDDGPNRIFWIYFLPKFVIGWLAIRYALFDAAHNLAAKIDLYHIGTVKLYDRLLFWIVRKKLQTYPAIFFWFTRLICLALGVSLILRI